MFRKVLVANRGEIAVRVIRALRELGIRSVAVYSEVDATSPHVWLADEAVPIGPAEPLESYLNIRRLIEAASRTGAEAIHPGYGFLAENAAFARACASSGIVFIGPPPEAIEALGNKARARRLAASVGVPTVPGTDRPVEDTEALELAHRIGFPILLKAAAGGGGRGMRVVHRPGNLPQALSSARREAYAAFGSDAILLERYIPRSRHVEVQILADAHGHVVHLGERECTIQRRYQKVIEEAPSVAVDDGLRTRLGEAAVRIARAAGYVNAGTVEFLLDPQGHFYFLEVNTRLQVEHPVTELVTGVDLVQAQVRIAAGEPLQIRQEDVSLRGHAIEARVYAEDPEREFAPSAGRILGLWEPHLPGVRVDSGIWVGQQIPVHYDPILAKLIAWGPDRPTAIARLRQALDAYVVLGPRTNLSFLRDVLEHPAFLAGEVSTEFLREAFGGWHRRPPSSEAVAIAAALLSRPVPTAPPPPAASFADPWDRLGGRRLP